MISRSGSGAPSAHNGGTAGRFPLARRAGIRQCDAQGRRGDPQRDFPKPMGCWRPFWRRLCFKLLPPASLVCALSSNVGLFEEAKERIRPRLALAEALTASAAKGAEPRMIADEAEFRAAERASVGHSSPPPRTPDLRKIRSSRRRARTLLVGFAEGVRPNMRSLCPETRR